MSVFAHPAAILSALLAELLFLPVEKHINLVYTGLAVAFALVLVFMFVYNKRH